MLKAVIMAGGTGTRLWPKSKPELPKQFVPLLDGQSMLQKTVQRLASFLPFEDICVVTLEKYVRHVREQVNLPAGNIFVEPESKDTAACIGLAAARFLQNGQDPVLITIPSDHHIDGEDAFREALMTACRQAEQLPCVVTVGIQPSRPETAYGYIKVKERVHDNLLSVERFAEKPDLSTAERWTNAPDYYWNSGIFVWKASTIETLIGQYMPALADSLRKIRAVLGTRNERKTLREEYGKLEKISIDYGVLEKASCTYLVPGCFVWDDMGSWSALERLIGKDRDGNVAVGEHKLLDTRNCIVYSEKAFVGTIGIEDLIITVTDQAVLICRKDKEQEIRNLVLKNADGGWRREERA